MTTAASDVPVDDRHFEDFVPGAVAEFGPIAVDEAEVIAFARQFDPQPIHTDPAAAAAGPFGGLIASGWHTASLVMRVLVEHYLARRASLASPGVDELRWLQPVRPGDVLRVRATVRRGATLALEARSRPRPDEDRSAESERPGGDEHGRAMNLFRCRDPGAAEALTPIPGPRRARHRPAAYLPRRRISTAPPPPACGGASQYASTSSQCASHLRTRPLRTGSRFGDVSPLPWIARTQR